MANSIGHSPWYYVGLGIMGLFYVVAGINHFVHPAMYTAIMPPYIPWPLGMIHLTGVAEIMGGIGVLIPNGFVFRRTRVAASWGIVALLIAIWPVHFNMALHPANYPSAPLWAIWFRLPLQIPLIVWAWAYTRA
jgi:uncharacterized membrane protein